VRRVQPGYKLEAIEYSKKELIPENWEIKKIHQICKIVNGSDFPLVYQKGLVGDIPFIKVSDMNFLENSVYISKTNQSISKNTMKIIKARICPINTIIFPKIGATIFTHKRGILEKESCFDNNIMGLIHVDVHFKYLFYWMDNIHLENFSQITAMPYLDSKVIGNIKIPIPSTIVQQKIASILSNVDNLIDSYDKAIDNSKKQKKGLMQKLLTKGIGHTKFKNELFKPHSKIQLGIVPYDWKIKPVKQLQHENYIIEFQDGNHGELHPKRDDFSSNGRPFLTASQIGVDNNIDFKNSNKLPEDFCKKLRIGFTQAKDVLFTHNATVGRAAIMPEDSPNSIVGTSVTYYRLNEEKLDRFFFYYIILSTFIKKQYHTEMDQTTRQQFSILKQAKLKFPLPDITEQQKIATILLKADSKISELESTKSKLERLKKGLMQKLLTGQIRVKA